MHSVFSVHAVNPYRTLKIIKTITKSNLPGIEPENIFCTDLYPENIFSDGEDKTSTNMSDDTLWTKLWMIYESDKKIKAVVIDLQTFKMEDYTKVE